METKELTAKEELEQLDARRNELKSKVALEKKELKTKTSQERVTRNNILTKKDSILNQIQKEVFSYKKLGKKAKFEIDIFEKIVNCMNPENIR